MTHLEESQFIQGQIREAQLESRLHTESEQLELYRAVLQALVDSLEGIEIQNNGTIEAAFNAGKRLIDKYRNKTH